MKWLRKHLAKIAANPAELLKVAPSACRATFTGGEFTLRENSTAITKSRRDELLAKCMAGEYVEIEADLLAYEQVAGGRNRNSVRFADGAMMALGASGKGTPFLRDHDQHDSLSKAGVVVLSKTERRGEGDYVIRQTVRLTATWAVELALRGLLGAVSIGWNPTGPVICSACEVPIFTKCWHCPGDRLADQDDGNGVVRKVRKADGPITVQWIYTKAELLECSMVVVGGVPTAEFDEIRASLSASLSTQLPINHDGNHLSLRDTREGSDFLNGDFPEETDDMDLAKLLALLGLPATATLSDALAEISKRDAAGAADSAELKIAKAELLVAQTELGIAATDRKKKAEDAFIVDALSTGRIAKGDEATWREFYQLSDDRAVKRMAERQPGSATPVGLPRQSGTDPAPVITGGTPAGASKDMIKVLAALQTTPRGKAFANAFGYVDPSGAEMATLGATSIVNAGELDAAKIGFHVALLQQLEQKTDDPIQELYTTVPSSKKLEEHNWMGDLPAFEEWIGDRKMSGLEAFKLRVQNKKWANGLRIKNDDFKDDSLGLLGPQVQGLGMKARRHRWDIMIKLLVNGFDGLAYPDVGNGLGYDGAFFFSDAGHRGGNDNRLAVALDAAGLNAAELLLESMTTYDGADPLDIHGTHIIVGPKLRAQAEKLLTQERLASGEDNYHRGKYKLIVTNRLRGTYDDYWFLTDLSSPIKPCLFQMREEISVSAVLGNQGSQQDSAPRFINDEVWFGAEARYNVAYFEHRTIVGSAVA